MKKHAALLAGLLPLLVGGCKPIDFKLPDTMPWLSSDEVVASRFEQPEKIVVIWSDAVYTQPGKPPTRGFGGRVYFYNNQIQTVPVEGQLIVYGYDDSTRGQGPQRSPDRKWVFKPEQFARHYSETEFGASYSIWLPWDAVGGPQQEISLLPVFRSAEGQVVMGDQSTNILPGKDTAEMHQTGVPLHHSRSLLHQPVQQVSYQQPAPVARAESQPQPPRTTTIRLPTSLAQHMAASPSPAQLRLELMRARAAAAAQHGAPLSPSLPHDPQYALQIADAIRSQAAPQQEEEPIRGGKAPWRAEDRLSGHFEHLKSQAPASQADRSSRGHSRSQQLPPESAYAPGAWPGSAWKAPSGGAW